jgi:prevent-host-death family protein
MKTHTMTEAKNDICSIIREAEKSEVLITRHGKPAAIVIGFGDEDDWFDYKLEQRGFSGESQGHERRSARAGSSRWTSLRIEHRESRGQAYMTRRPFQ